MTENPYESRPSLTIDHQRIDELSGGWRFFVGIYGVFFTAFCAMGTFDDLRSTRPTSYLIFWLVMSLLTCYGIWALAIPKIRMRVLSAFWRILWIVLPILAYSVTYFQVEDGDIPDSFPGLLFSIALFLAITLPAFVCNWLLSELLRSPAKNA